MSGYKVEVVKGSPKSGLGEGPYWDTKNQELLYVDQMGYAVLRHVTKTGETMKVDLGEHVSLVVPVENDPGKYIISFKRDIKVMEWDGQSSKPSSLKRLYTVDDDHPNNKLNDGKCDATGRLWIGTMGESAWDKDPKAGAFYSFDVDGKVKKHFDKVDISNGLAWTSDNSVLYYADSLSFKVDAFDFDLAAGTLSNRRTAFELGPYTAADGMTIDANGNLWIAIFGGSRVIHVDPKVGKQIGQVDFPTTHINSVTFGGPNLDILYATTAADLIDPKDAANQPTAGNLFQVTNLGAKGLAPFNYKGPV